MNHTCQTLSTSLSSAFTILFATAAVASSSEKADDAEQRLQKYDSGCTKNTLSGNRFSAAAQPIP